MTDSSCLYSFLVSNQFSEIKSTSQFLWPSWHLWQHDIYEPFFVIQQAYALRAVRESVHDPTQEFNVPAWLKTM